MEENFEIRIKKNYPSDWNDYNKQKKEKKEQEFDVASFFLKDTSVNTQFLDKGELCVDFYDEPDFWIYSKEMPKYKIGLEVTRCYADEKCNAPKFDSDLEKICKEVVNEINNDGHANLVHNINYINVTFSHKIMTGERYDSKKLKLELKASLINENKQKIDYVRQAKAEYSAFYPTNDITVNINSDMMYLVPEINDTFCIQNDTNVKYQDPVMRCIEKKERKLKDYKEKCSDLVYEWWLCIEVPEDAYLNPQSYKLPEAFKSGYNKIALVTRSFFGYGTHIILNHK